MRKLGLTMAGGIAAAVVAVATGPAPAHSTIGAGAGGEPSSLHAPASDRPAMPLREARGPAE